MSSSQRPFFLSTFFSAIRQQQHTQQPNKHAPSGSNPATSSTASSANSAPRAIASSSQSTNHTHQSTRNSAGGVVNQLPLHSPRGGIPIPAPSGGRRRGSDSSSEGFREVLGADKWYIGGRTATGEEKYFKLGVVRRVRSNDGFSLDKLSL
ncbi:hypothetical protein jhhlp_003926 [Lomentospora prolificans]|uniref:Uncharacterized protein n=1 Tax=Lomentospora prolificans TaxID=41688 RepID=A0A2N3NAA8_9PEZI|nr:hypothetical protein jhhlp_003926 [Lomentospora prolificans]